MCLLIPINKVFAISLAKVVRKMHHHHQNVLRLDHICFQLAQFTYCQGDTIPILLLGILKGIEC